MSLLLTIASQPISKICIPRRLVNSFLPCKRSDEPIFDEAKSCEAKVNMSIKYKNKSIHISVIKLFYPHKNWEYLGIQGMVSLVSEVGVNQLQLLIFTLAVFHVLSCIVTLGLGEIKVNIVYVINFSSRRIYLYCLTNLHEAHKTDCPSEITFYIR